MSAAEQSVPAAPELPEEVRCRAEDPDFPIVLARARARARGEVYAPDRHGPFAPKMKPKAGPQAMEPMTGNLQDTLDRFMARAKPQRERADWR